MRIALIGASGYTGAEMIRLLAEHPEFELSGLYAGSSAGQSLAQHYPELDRGGDRIIEPVDVSRIAASADWAVLGLPHGTSAIIAAELLDAGVGVVDLSASFRLSPDLYDAHYGGHPCPERIAGAVYGLPELRADQLPGARLIAGPGCFPTGVTIACAPLYGAGLAGPGPLIADCKTGLTGAGATASATTHFCRVADTVTPYKVEGHRHAPEIARNLSWVAGATPVVRFTPHLVPVRRGILSTCYVPTTAGATGAQLRQAMADFAGPRRFVHLLPEGLQPSMARVAGTNRVELQVVEDRAAGLAVVTSAIDNLCKGSSGGALQALNIAVGVDEGAGLDGLRPATP